MANNFDDTFTANLVGLWDFRHGAENKDTGLDDGFAQNGHFENGASAYNDQLKVDGKNDYFDVNGKDDPFDLSKGTIIVEFTQKGYDSHAGDTVVNRGEFADREHEGFFEIRVFEDGRVEAFHQSGNSSTLSTGKGFFTKGDVVKATYVWDETSGNKLIVENLTEGTSTTLEGDVKGLTMDIGDNDDENFTFGARETDDGHYGNYFDGLIDYVAVYDADVTRGALDGVVTGSNAGELIDIAYDGDPEGDRVDNNDSLVPPGTNDDVIDALGGNDTILAGEGNDTVYAGSGNDSVQGGNGDDVIYGDSNLAHGVTGASRESFEWDLATDKYGDPVENGDKLETFTQNTGNVDVTFSILSERGSKSEFADNDQNIKDIKTDGAAADDNSSLSSELDKEHEFAKYQLKFSDPVEKVSFRINDIDGDGLVKVQAFDMNNNPITVNLTAGSRLTLEDTDSVPGADTADGDGRYLPDTSGEYSVLVDIPGPVSKIVIEHRMDGHNNTGINVTDVYFDVPIVTPTDDGADGNDTLFGGEGNDLIYGEGGNDKIDGGNGNDTLFGDSPDAGTAMGPNLVVNGSFEDTTGLTRIGNSHWNGKGAIPGWTDEKGLVINVHFDERGGVPATDGDNWLDLEASPGNNRIGQDIAGVQAGEAYRLTFDAGDKKDEPQSGPQENLVNVYWGGELIATVDPNPGKMDSYTFDVVGGAGDGSNRLVFEGSGTKLDNFGASVDNVKLFKIVGEAGPAGNDTIHGGKGDDLIFGQGGDDELFGNEGNDLIVGGDGNDKLGGAEGDDTLMGGAGNDTLTGGSGNDLLNGGMGDDLIDAGSGNDTVVDMDGNNTITTGPVGLPDRGFPFVGNADLNPNDDRDSVTTGDGNDWISTGDDRDTIYAGGGNDTIDSGFDDDLIYAGDGDDLITSGEGSDTVYGGAGNDTIYGGLGPGSDIFNLIDDNVDPSRNDPILDNGKDLIYGGDGDDLIFGQDDDDTIFGGNGNDTIDGGIDDDLIDGGAGDDLIIGGQGADTMFGGEGNDTFKIGIYTDPIFGDQYQEGIGDVVIGGEDADDKDIDKLDLTGAGPLRVIYDDAIDPTGTPGESGIVKFYDGNGFKEENVTGKLTFKEIENVIPCFTPGARIATPRGEVAVEMLKVGDKVITRDNGIQEIRWIGNRTLQRAELRQAPYLRPVLIKAGSLGEGLPERDMIVSPQHRMLVTGASTQLHFEESEVLVAAKHLVNHGSVQWLDPLRATYIHFMFDQHEVVLADGSWTESFQPGDQTLGAMGNNARKELLEIFPDLKTPVGRDSYVAARRALKKHEAKLILR